MSQGEIEPPQQSSSGSTAGASELQHYKERATALLQVSTFAAAITLSIILTPRDNSQTTPGLVQLAYANALFCGAIIGSVFVTIGIEVATAQPAIVKKLTLNRKSVVKVVMKVAMKAVQEVKAAQETKAAETKAAQLMKAGAIGNLQVWSVQFLLWSVHIVIGFVGLSVYAAFYIMIYATRLYLQYDGPFILGTVIYAVLGFLIIFIWLISSALEREE